MNRIEPGELQERFDRGLKRGALLGAANKMKYWDLYGEFYQVLNQRNEQGLPSVFAEELARTYAERATQKEEIDAGRRRWRLRRSLITRITPSPVLAMRRRLALRRRAVSAATQSRMSM